MLQEWKKKEDREGFATAWWCQWTLCALICEEFSDCVLMEHETIGTMQALDDPQYYSMSCFMAELGHWDIQKELFGSPKYIQTVAECAAHWNNSFDLLVLRVYNFDNEYNQYTQYFYWNFAATVRQHIRVKRFPKLPVYFSNSELLSSYATLSCQVNPITVFVTKYIYICASVNKFNDVG